MRKVSLDSQIRFLTCNIEQVCEVGKALSRTDPLREKFHAEAWKLNAQLERVLVREQQLFAISREADRRGLCNADKLRKEYKALQLEKYNEWVRSVNEENELLWERANSDFYQEDWQGNLVMIPRSQ